MDHANWPILMADRVSGILLPLFVLRSHIRQFNLRHGELDFTLYSHILHL